jgi:hypothetical protein
MYGTFNDDNHGVASYKNMNKKFHFNKKPQLVPFNGQYIIQIVFTYRHGARTNRNTFKNAPQM